MSKRLKDYESVLKSFGVTDEAHSKIEIYLDRLIAVNEEINVYSRKMELKELIENHIIDCLMTLPWLPPFKKLADLGSGGGLPAALFAIMRPESQVVAFEKSVLKSRFLSSLSDIIPNLSVQSLISNDLKEFDLVSARAFKPTDVILDMTSQYARSEGRYFLLKGKREKIDEETVGVEKKYKLKSLTVLPIQSPLLEVERHIVKINF